MCTDMINGVLVVREGARRLRWRHEVRREPSPRQPDDWVIGDLWPDGEARNDLARRLAEGGPILVVLDRESPVVTLPIENIPIIPAGAVVDESDGDMITVSVPALDWLNKRYRDRGKVFAARASAIMSRTPRSLLPPFLTEPQVSPHRDPVQFVHATGAGHQGPLRDIVDRLFDGRERPLPRQSDDRDPVADRNCPCHGADLILDVSA